MDTHCAPIPTTMRDLQHTYSPTKEVSQLMAIMLFAFFHTD
jgi:hypothetical protein